MIENPFKQKTKTGREFKPPVERKMRGFTSSSSSNTRNIGQKYKGAPKIKQQSTSLVNTTRIVSSSKVYVTSPNNAQAQGAVKFFSLKQVSMVGG
jgi:hypothetical protein